MTTLEPQLSSRGSKASHDSPTHFGEPANAQPLAQRPITSSSLALNEHKLTSRVQRVPPAAPSPPTRSAMPDTPAEAVALHPSAPKGSHSRSVEAKPADTQILKGEFVAPRLDQWTFTDEEIDYAPSIIDGISPLEERTRRAKGVNFIIQAGILLKIPQTTLSTAAVFFHRFYMRYSMVPEKNGIHHYVRDALPRSRSFHNLKAEAMSHNNEDESLTGCQNIAATALFLATKAEETCRKTKDIVIAVARVAQKNAGLIIDEQSKEFWRWKDSILAYEETMLELLTFDVVLQSPYSHLYDCLKILDIENHKTLRNTAWAYLNDSCMTTVCLRVTPKDTAISGIYFAAKYTQEGIPDDSEHEPWWTRVGGNAEKIIQAIQVMTQFYNDNPLRKLDQPFEPSPGGTMEDLEKTRLRHDSQSPNGRLKAEEVENKTNASPFQGDEPKEEESEDEAMEDVKVEAELETTGGDDDTGLKAAANNPETHKTSAASGLVNGNGRKRSLRDDEDAGDKEEAEIKKAKVEEDEAESDEGEIEE